MVDGVWDTGASSQQTIGSTGGAVEFPAAQTDKSVVIGLSNEDLDHGYSHINYAIMLRDDSYLQVYEKGTPVGSLRPYALNDVFRISIEEELFGQHVVKYYQNDELIHTSEGPPSFPLIVDVSLRDEGSVIRDVKITGYLPTISKGNIV